MYKGRAAEKQEDGVQHAAQHQCNGVDAEKGGEHCLPVLGIQHIRQESGDNHGEDTGHQQGCQQTVGGHAHQQLTVKGGAAKEDTDVHDAQQQHNAQQHGTDAHGGGIAHGAEHGKQAALAV